MTGPAQVSEDCTEEPVYSVIIPAHNEQDRIATTLADFAAVFADSEIIVVMNGCRDATAERVIASQKQSPNIAVIDIAAAVGKGGAVRAGFVTARSRIIAYADADGSTPAAELRRLCTLLKDAPETGKTGIDGIIGSRWLPQSVIEIAQPPMRRVASRVFNALVRLFFGLHFYDTQCGAKVFRLSALNEILAQVETSNLAFDVDVLYMLKRKGKVVLEVPSVWRDALGSRVNLLSASLQMLAALLRLRLRHSLMRVIVPLFDRAFPTRPLRTHGKFSILVLNWRDIQHPQAGGAEIYLHEQAKRWVALGHEVEWLTSRFSGSASVAQVDGITIRRVGNNLTVYALLPLEYLRSCRDRFDIIVDSENGIPFFSPLFSLKPKVCLMHHVHRTVFLTQLRPPLSWLLFLLESVCMPFVYRNVSFVAVSEDTRAAMNEHRFSKRSVAVVPNGVSSHLRPGEKSAQPLVLYLGRLRPYKRLHLLIEAMQQVQKIVPEASLVIAGRGDDEARLRALTSRIGLDARVRFEGYVDESRKLELLQRAWVFVSPSLIEGWGNTVIEANACGTPAIAFDVPGLREAIVDGYSGSLVPDGGDLGAAIAGLLADSQRRRILAEGALQRAAGYSWERSAQAMLRILLDQAICNPHAFVRSQSDWKLLMRTADGLQESRLAPTRGG